MDAWKFVFYSKHLSGPNITHFWSLSALLKHFCLWWTSKSKGLSVRFRYYDSRIIKQMKLHSCKSLRSWQAYAIFLAICFITASENATSFRNASLRPLMQSTSKKVLGITFIYKTKLIKSCSTQQQCILVGISQGTVRQTCVFASGCWETKHLKMGDYSTSYLENVLPLYKPEYLP